MPHAILIALHQRAEARDSRAELDLPQADQRERTARLAVWFWLLLMCSLAGLWLAEWVVRGTLEGVR